MQPSPLPISRTFISSHTETVLIGIYLFNNLIFLILFFLILTYLELQMHPSPRIDPIPLLSSNLSGKRQIPWKQKSFFLLLLPPNPACLINIDSKVHLSHGQNITPTDYLLIAKGNIPLQWKDLLVTTLTTLTISTTRGKEHCAHLLTWHNLKCSIT